MHCPNCGTENADTFKFCQRCGTRLPAPAVPQPVQPNGQVGPNRGSVGVIAAQPKNPVSEIATIGAAGSGLGGALIVLGWFTPWFSLSGIIGELLGPFSGLAQQLGFLRSGSGVGNALQVSYLALAAGVAGFKYAPLLALLVILIAAFLVALLVLGALYIRNAFRLYELRPANPVENATKLSVIASHISTGRGRAIIILIVLATVFFVSAAIPFAISVLGAGFWLTVLGAACVFVSAWYAQNQIKLLRI